MGGELLQHRMYLVGLQVHQHALAQHEQRLLQGLARQVQRLPPVGVADIQNGLAQAW